MIWHFSYCHHCRQMYDATVHKNYWHCTIRWWNRISRRWTLTLVWHWAIPKKNFAKITSKCWSWNTHTHVTKSILTLNYNWLGFVFSLSLFFWNRKSQLLALLLCIGSIDIALGNQEAEQRFLDVLRDLYNDGTLDIEDLSFWWSWESKCELGRKTKMAWNEIEIFLRRFGFWIDKSEFGALKLIHIIENDFTLFSFIQHHEYCAWCRASERENDCKWNVMNYSLRTCTSLTRKWQMGWAQ